MGDINVISRTEDIRVSPARQSINVFNLPHEEVILIQPTGVKLINSYPANWTNGMWMGGGDQHLYDFTLPSNIKVGDHIRITHWGSIGSNTGGGVGWYYRIWLDGISTGADVYAYVAAAQTGGKRVAYMAEIDIMMQSISSVWVYHKFAMAGSFVPGTSQAPNAPGTYHFETYKNTAQNIPGMGCRLTAQCSGGLAPGSDLHVRGMIAEHLIAP